MPDQVIVVTEPATVVTVAAAPQGPPGPPGITLTVREVDGTPSINPTTTLEFQQTDGFVVTDQTGGVARLSLNAVPYARLSLSNSIINSDVNSSANIALSKLADGSLIPTSIVNDTNVTGSLSGNALTLGWTATLADVRISSAATWNAKVGPTRAINTGNGLQGGGDLSADRIIDLRLNISGGLSKTLGAGSNELGIADSGVVDAMLAAGISSSKLSGALPALDGSALTNLNASNLASGTVPLARLSGITNAEISASAAIAISKLAITGTPDGTKFLRDDGSWQAIVGGGTPGGSNKQVQYNNSGAFGGAAGFEYQSGASPNLKITAQNINHTPLIAAGLAGQVAPLLQLDKDVTAQFQVKPDGNLIAGVSGTSPPGYSQITGYLIAGSENLSGTTIPGPSGMSAFYAGLILGDPTQNNSSHVGGVFVSMRNKNNKPLFVFTGFDSGSASDIYYGGGGWGGTIANNHRFYTASSSTYPSTSGETLTFRLRNPSDGVSTLAATLGITASNLLLGTTTNGTGTAVLQIKNGTAPTTSPADAVQLYSEDVSASAELKVRDEAGNVTTLSPHNFSLFQPDPSERAMPIGYYSRNEYAGVEMNIDLIGSIRAVEKLTGKQFVYLRELAADQKRDWQADEELKWLSREEERADWLGRKAAHEREQVEFDKLSKEEKTGRVRPTDFTEPEPAIYTRRPEPQWLTDRKNKPVRIKQRKSRFALVSYTSPIINAKQTGQTVAFKTDDDHGDFIPVSVSFVCESANGVTTPAVVSVGINGQANNLATNRTMPAADKAAKVFNLTDSLVVPPDRDVKVNITTASVATGRHEIRAIITGFYQDN